MANRAAITWTSSVAARADEDGASWHTRAEVSGLIPGLGGAVDVDVVRQAVVEVGR